MTTRTIAYIRVSTDKQADAGVSLDAQRAKVEQYAALYDLDLVAVKVDAGESAKSLDRPALREAFAMLDAGEADALLVVKLDRLTRSVRDLGESVERFFSKDVALLSVSEQIDTRTAGGRLVLNVLASVSQWEREVIGERTSVAMRHMQSEGRYIGGNVPYGFHLVDGELVEHDAEQEVIAEARKLRTAGLSLRAVAERLSKRGFKTRSGRAFIHTQVARIAA